MLSSHFSKIFTRLESRVIRTQQLSDVSTQTLLPYDQSVSVSSQVWWINEPFQSFDDKRITLESSNEEALPAEEDIENWSTIACGIFFQTADRRSAIAIRTLKHQEVLVLPSGWFILIAEAGFGELVSSESRRHQRFERRDLRTTKMVPRFLDFCPSTDASAEKCTCVFPRKNYHD